MPIDISRLLDDSPELTDRFLEAGSAAAGYVGERLDEAATGLRRNPSLLIAGGVIVGFAAAGIYFGARYWRTRELERLQAERRTLELDIERELQLIDSVDDLPLAEPDMDDLPADGRSVEEIARDSCLPAEAINTTAALTEGPRSQDSSIIEAEFADRTLATESDPGFQ